MAFVILTGASGAGKTTIARAIAARRDAAVKVFFFDSVGVPPTEKMIERYGSREAWQRVTTNEWMMRLAGEATTAQPVLFEGQMRFSFLAEGAVAAGLAYVPVLVDCADETRARRLSIERRQSELANAEMMNWARYLRNEAAALGYPILETSALSLQDCVEWVMELLEG